MHFLYVKKFNNRQGVAAADFLVKKGVKNDRPEGRKNGCFRPQGVNTN